MLDPSGAPKGKETAADRRNRVIHTFGNLTLLSGALNSSVSNGPYEKKRPQIAKQSLLRLNVWFQDTADWNEDRIRERGRALFATALRLWPRSSLSAPETRRSAETNAN